MDTKFDSILGKLREKDAGSGPGGSVDWSDIQGKPSTFTPSAHNHTQGEVTGLTDDLAGKANTADLATVATSGDYTDLSNKPTIPTVNDSTVTIVQGSTTRGSFTTNQAGDSTITLNDGANYTFESPLVETSGTVSLGEQYLKLTGGTLNNFVIDGKRSDGTISANRIKYFVEDRTDYFIDNINILATRIYAPQSELTVKQNAICAGGRNTNYFGGYVASDWVKGDITAPQGAGNIYGGFIGRYFIHRLQTIPTNASIYTMDKGVFTHAPTIAVTYTLPTPTDTTIANEIILYVDMTTTTSISFVDGGGTTIIPSLAGTPAVGEKWVFLASYSFGAWHVIGYKEA